MDNTTAAFHGWTAQTLSPH